MAEDEQRHRVVVLGAGAVGKSSIVRRFLHGTYQDTYKATVEDLHCRDYEVSGSLIRVDLLDTAGNLEFPAMRRLSISTAHAFILVFALDNHDSFIEVQNLWEQIKEQRSNYGELACVVVGNKADLVSCVPREEAVGWVAEQGLQNAFLEVSAKDDQGIVSVFKKLLQLANLPSLTESQRSQVEPMLQRRVSAKESPRCQRPSKLGSGTSSGGGSGGRLGRSRSLIRRTNKPKVKNTGGDPNRNDCSVS